MKVHLHIDRIVLDGVTLSPQETRRMADALKSELSSRITAMMAHPTTPHEWRGGAVASLAAPPITLSEKGNGGARLGRDLARSIHGCVAPASKGGERP